MAQSQPRAPQTEPAKLSGLAQAMAERMKLRLGRLVQGSAEDVQKYASAMAGDLAQASALGDPELVDHLAAQSRMLGEKLKLRAKDAQWGAVQDLVLDLGYAASAALVQASS